MEKLTSLPFKALIYLTSAVPLTVQSRTYRLDLDMTSARLRQLTQHAGQPVSSLEAGV